MPRSEYPGGPSPVTLLDRYNQLIRDGWFPSQAKEILSTLLMGEHFHTPFGAKLGFELGSDDRLIVMLDGDKLDPGKVPTRDPDPNFDPKPVPIDQRAFEQRMDALATAEQQRDRLLKAAMISDKPRTIEQYLAENPGALKDDDEAKAAEWLAPKLTPDDEVTRETFRHECIQKFKLSDVGYRERVWYAARYLANLPRERKSGAPKGPRPASIPKKSRRSHQK